MPTPLPSPAGQDRRDAILAAAADLFARQGYAAVSMRDLAAAVHLTPAALYYHFPDKSALYSAVIGHVFKAPSHMFMALLEEKASDREILRKLIALIAEAFYRDESLCRLFRRELLDGDDKRLAILTEEILRAPFDALRPLMQRLVPEHDALLSATSIFGLILAHIELIPLQERLTGLPGTGDPIQQIVRHINHVVFHGLAVPPADDQQS